MAMCDPCKATADLVTVRRTQGNSRPSLPHPCRYPHSCTCQHGDRSLAEPVPRLPVPDLTTRRSLKVGRP